MPDRADAHIHLFAGSYQGSFTVRPGMQIDEAEAYTSLAELHHVRAALVVGFAGKDWCATNNEHLARVAPRFAWTRPAAYVGAPENLSTADLDAFAGQGFVGIACYLFGDDARRLERVDDAVWGWLVERRWLVSVNAKGDAWTAWAPILARHGNLRLVASHLGLPPAIAERLSPDEARRRLAPVLDLAAHAGSRVKLSGFYALTDPGHDYPHEAAWPYVEALLEAFGPDRLLWASDFSPCLDHLSFPQTFGLFEKMPFLDPQQRAMIEGGNLLALLEAIER